MGWDRHIYEKPVRAGRRESRGGELRLACRTAIYICNKESQLYNINCLVWKCSLKRYDFGPADFNREWLGWDREE